MLKKGFSTILIIVIVLVVIAGGVLVWQYWPEPADNGQSANGVQQAEQLADETADWQIYRNEEYGFEMKHPKDWKKKATDARFPSESVAFQKFKDEINYCIMGATISKDIGEVDILETVDMSKKQGYEESTILIDGITAIRLTRSGPGPIDILYFLHRGDGLTVTLWKGLGTDVEEECIIEFNQILSTFRFLN